MLALDIETAPLKGQPQEYALQPWRLQENKAHVSCISVAKATGEAILITNKNQYRALLTGLKGKTITTWNGIFDVAWLIAMGFESEVKAINWVDGMILWKWLINSQLTDRTPKWSLAAGAKYFFKDEAWCASFVKMKKEEVHAGENDQYWETRAKLDSIVTARITEKVLEKLDDRRTKSAMITMSGIVPLAGSWVRGVNIDFSLIDEITPSITAEMAEIEYRLGVHNNQGLVQMGVDGWQPSKILRSPKQLGELLFTTWRLEAKDFSEKTGAPSTSKAALTYLADSCDQVLEILRWRMLNTQLSKYIQSPLKAREYLGSDVLHPCPRIFSTYTGRSVYTSKTAKKYPTGLALHQMPRQKEFRAFIKPREGYKHLELDAASQESRLMAVQSGDASMTQVFEKHMDYHSFTGAKISGMSYTDFMDGKAKGNTAIVGSSGLRYAGKFLNLSQNFRVGPKKMRIQARVQYNLNIDFLKARDWQQTWQLAYPGVKKYWAEAISKAKTLGYAESLAGRRFHLMFWGKEDRWSTESSALMTPIQASAADMGDIAIQELTKYFPEFELWFTLHDACHFEIPVDTPDSRIIEARTMLNNIDYQKWWGYTPPIPLLYDASVGARWSELVELD